MNSKAIEKFGATLTYMASECDDFVVVKKQFRSETYTQFNASVRFPVKGACSEPVKG